MMKKLVCVLLLLCPTIWASLIPISRSVSVEAAGEVVDWGANLAGLAMGGRADGVEYARHGVYGSDYKMNTPAELAYLKSKGLGYCRLQFIWYRVQHTLYGELDAVDLGYLDEVLALATSNGLHVSIVPFDYGRYYSVADDGYYVIGDANCPYSAFSDLWTKLATHFKGKVWAYDLMNEPYDMGDGVWFATAQVAIDAIRAVDGTTPIVVPGDGHSSCAYWYESGNDCLKDLVDPSSNLIFEGHQYFDGDASGRYSDGDTIPGYDGEPKDRARSLLAPFVNWLRANGKTGLIGEMGTPGSPFWLSVLAAACDYLVQSDDVIKQVQLQSCWTSPWKDDYGMSLVPDGDDLTGPEKPQTTLVSDGYVGLDNAGVVATDVDCFTSSGTWTCPAGVTSVAVLIVAGGGSGGFDVGGGGGAGGVIYEANHAVIPLQDYSVVVGDGGASVSVPGPGNNGGNSSFDGLTAMGGGAGGSATGQYDGSDGGSGGGGGHWNGTGGTGTAGQGFDGGDAGYLSGGGGGKGGPGICPTWDNNSYPLGGEGLDYSDVFGSAYGYSGFFAGGGGGCATAAASGDGGKGGGGDGEIPGTSAATSGAANSGGGGGGAYGGWASGAGGTGTVLIGLNPNQAPVLDAIGDKTSSECAALIFTVSGSDPDGDSLTYSASTLPRGAGFDAAGRTFTWTPGYDQSGTYSVHFELTDGELTDHEDVAIAVRNVDRPPTLDAIGNRTVTEGTALTITTSGSDADGDALTYTASALPPGASFDATTRTFTWTPAHGQSGTYGVHFEVTDGELTDCEDITVTVASRSPVWLWPLIGIAAVVAIASLAIAGFAAFRRYGDQRHPGQRESKDA